MPRYIRARTEKKYGDVVHPCINHQSLNALELVREEAFLSAHLQSFPPRPTLKSWPRLSSPNLHLKKTSYTEIRWQSRA